MWPTSIATTTSGRSGALQARAPNWIPWIDRWENENIDKPQWAAWKLRICDFFLLQSAAYMGIFCCEDAGCRVLYAVFYLIIWELANWQLEDDGSLLLWMAAVMLCAWGTVGQCGNSEHYRGYEDSRDDHNWPHTITSLHAIWKVKNGCWIIYFGSWLYSRQIVLIFSHKCFIHCFYSTAAVMAALIKWDKLCTLIQREARS